MKKKKCILLTNDDGYMSEGIVSLREHLLEDYDVYLVAPDTERSAVSMALTLHQPIRVEPVGPEGDKIYSVSGTPSDCINLALEKILPGPPDFVVSGMNFGENLSYDIFYSGTVGGAFSGHLFGIPSLAVSLIPENREQEPWVYDVADGAGITLRVLKYLFQRDNKGKEIVYNLNIPYGNNGKILVTGLGFKRYRPGIEERVDPRGKKYYWFGTGNPTYGGEKGTDIWAVHNGYISLSVIKYDLDCPEETKALVEELGEREI